MINNPWDVTKEQIADYQAAETKIIFNYLLNINSIMIHSVNLTTQELSAAGAFLLLADHGTFTPGDFLVITVKGDDGKLTRQQSFFNIVTVQDATNTRGVRKGYAMIKIKRTKNPLPKTETETEVEETETDNS